MTYRSYLSYKSYLLPWPETENPGDIHWNSSTSAGYNSASTPFVAYTAASVAAGVGPGDWAQITNDDTGGTIWALCGDYSDGHPEGETSEAACAQLGIQFYANSYTLMTVPITIQYYAHSRGQ
jgi:hypothetical protein